MAAGLPVVATMTEGASEIIDDGQTGLLAPIGEAEQLAERINRLLMDAAQRHSLGNTARQTVAECFALDRMIEETENVYREAVL